MNTSSWSVYISSIEHDSSLALLWIHWKHLSIMPWSDYLVVRLLTHSHHYITEGSLWNYSAIYHSLLYGPYTLNDRLPLRRDTSVREYRISPGELYKLHTARNRCWPFICQLMCTHSMHCRNMQIGKGGQEGETLCRSHAGWPLGYNGLWICVCT